MDRMVQYNQKISDIGNMNVPDALKTVMRLPYIERIVAEIFQVFIMTPVKQGAAEFSETAVQY